MDIILRNGDKLYKKHSKNYDDVNKLIDMLDLCAGDYQAQFIKREYENHKKSIHKDYNIYGDDFKIEFTPQNVIKDCVLSIKDYDENQKLENEINIGFNKSELGQFINLLQIIREQM